MDVLDTCRTTRSMSEKNDKIAFRFGYKTILTTENDFFPSGRAHLQKVFV